MFRKAVYRSLLIATLISSCVVAPLDVGIKTREPTTIIIAATVTEHSVIQGGEPNVEKICPSNSEVRINELGLPDDLVLLATGKDEILGDTNHPLRSTILLFSSETLTPKRIDNIVSFDDDLVVDVRLSPSGQWLSIIRWHENSQQKTIWISRIDGENQRMIAEIDRMQRVFWISDSEVLVVGVPNEADYEGGIPEEDMRPLFSINVLTLETRNLAPLPTGGIYVYNSYHSKGGVSYSIFYKVDNQKKTYFLYDYDKGTSTQIFRWVEADPTVGVGIRSNGLYYIARRVEGGFDFALDLTKVQIMEYMNYNDVMSRFLFGGDQNLIISPMFNWTKSEIPILTSAPLDDQKPTPFYLFNYEANILKDYCINLGLNSAFFSPDEQFAVFTIYEGIDTLSYHVLILNLKTGYYSLIKDIKAIGFGILQ